MIKYDRHTMTSKFEIIMVIEIACTTLEKNHTVHNPLHESIVNLKNSIVTNL
jgi:hypothetical protein